jgi:hypothetical protein
MMQGVVNLRRELMLAVVVGKRFFTVYEVTALEG